MSFLLICMYGNSAPSPKKNILIFPSPSGVSLTKLSLGGNNDVIYKLFPPWESLVSDTDISAGDGKPLTFFYSVERPHVASGGSWSTHFLQIYFQLYLGSKHRNKLKNLFSCFMKETNITKHNFFLSFEDTLPSPPPHIDTP